MAEPFNPTEMPNWLTRLWPKTKMPRYILAGIDEDDCAVVKWRHGYLLMTTDFLNANPMALELGIGTMWDLGRLVVASNLSDLCSSGANPLAMLIAATLPYGSSKHDFQEFMRGIKHESNRYGVPVVGGDTKLGHARTLLGVGIGSVNKKKQLFLKRTAKPGDLLWVSGNIGSVAASVAGFRLSGLSRQWKRWATNALLVPHVPLRQSRAISRRSIGHGGTDISDGLAVNLKNLCIASHVGAIVDAAKIPCEPGVQEVATLLDVPAWTFSLTSGGDFQFLLTTAPWFREDVQAFGFREIGNITKMTGIKLKLPTGQIVKMPDIGHRDRRGQTFTQEIHELLIALRSRRDQNPRNQSSAR